MYDIRKILCCFDKHSDQIGNDKNILEGEILIEQDGWFEGIIFEQNSNYNKGQFIFGVYIENKVIYFYKISPINIDNSLKFYVNSYNDTYLGNFSIVTNIGESIAGNCSIKINKLEKEKEIDIKNNIDFIKVLLSYNESIDLYKNSLQSRMSIISTVLNNYESNSNNKLEHIDRQEDIKKMIKN